MAERSLHVILDDLRLHITEHCLDEKQADMFMQKVDIISQMMNRLLQLRVELKVILKKIFVVSFRRRFYYYFSTLG